MKWYTAPVNQGQIVTVSYGQLDGALLRRTSDASDRSETIRMLADPWGELATGSAEAAELEDWCPWNSAAPEWLDALLDEASLITDKQIAAMEEG